MFLSLYSRLARYRFSSFAINQTGVSSAILGTLALKHIQVDSCFRGVGMGKLQGSQPAVVGSNLGAPEIYFKIEFSNVVLLRLHSYPQKLFTQTSSY